MGFFPFHVLLNEAEESWLLFNVIFYDSQFITLSDLQKNQLTLTVSILPYFGDLCLSLNAIFYLDSPNLALRHEEPNLNFQSL